ncbi:hypothetical protein TNCV_2180571 [Trichonephila clavipes]|uniref:Uncharacterized protein n=1 Tax=Trichonephila clavipes TaxID=2585209 RepID=A0A8X6VUQ6_TRICX|nr:hypothetical protein TNCV_2180571 [Trichonephila clavipes]
MAQVYESAENPAIGFEAAAGEVRDMCGIFANVQASMRWIQDDYITPWGLPLKTHRVEELIHVTFVGTQMSSCGVVWKSEESVPALRCCPRHLTMVQNDEAHLRKHLCSIVNRMTSLFN